MEEKIIYKAIIPGVLPGCNEYVLGLVELTQWQLLE